MRLAAATLDLAVARETRVQRITDRIRISAGDLCKGDRAPIFGILAASEEEVPCSLRGVVVERFGQGDWVGQQDCDSESGLGKNVFVLDVRTDTPAERAAIRVGDHLVSMDGKKLERGDVLHRKRSTRVGPQVEFVLRRGEELIETRLEHMRGCYPAAHTRISDYVNAFWGIGHRLVMLTGMVRFVESDDELALIMGHELAHYILRTGGNANAEADADYLGAYLAARAGYDPSVGPALWRRMALRRLSREDQSYYSHPSAPKRVLWLESVAKEIAGKLERGEPLEPRRVR